MPAVLVRSRGTRPDYVRRERTGKPNHGQITNVRGPAYRAYAIRSDHVLLLVVQGLAPAVLADLMRLTHVRHESDPGPPPDVFVRNLSRTAQIQAELRQPHPRGCA